jgi:hypothetical protein
MAGNATAEIQSTMEAPSFLIHSATCPVGGSLPSTVELASGLTCITVVPRAAAKVRALRFLLPNRQVPRIQPLSHHQAVPPLPPQVQQAAIPRLRQAQQAAILRLHQAHQAAIPRLRQVQPAVTPIRRHLPRPVIRLLQQTQLAATILPVTP